MFKLDLTPETLQQVSVLVGVFLPLFISWLIGVHWSLRVKQFVAIGVAVVAAVVISLVREGFSYDTADSFLHSVFVIIGVAQTFYLTLWSTIGSRLTQKLEKSTNPASTMLGNALNKPT